MAEKYKLISTDNYGYKSWSEIFQNNVVSLRGLYIHPDWEDFFEKVKQDKRFKEIEDFLSHCLEVTDRKIKIYPYPELLFSSFNATPLKELKVVILGQDPYHQNEKYGNSIIPQAMGMSFSVPVGMKIPSSLNNIYGNLVKHKHVTDMPKHGNLESWAYQGVLMINSALTVQHGYPNGHADKWSWMTDMLIKYISDMTEHTVFVLWGSPAYSKRGLINQSKHLIVASSHPSGLSSNNKMGDRPSFNSQDHFKLINDYLTKHGKGIIVWEI
jgi:uracil-DNA glycosylase